MFQSWNHLNQLDDNEIIQVSNFSALPTTGQGNKIYITTDDDKAYRWNGSAYIEVSAPLQLGNTSTTAYRGDYGETAYSHSQAGGNPHGTTITNIPGLQVNIEQKANSADVVPRTGGFFTSLVDSGTWHEVLRVTDSGQSTRPYLTIGNQGVFIDEKDLSIVRLGSHGLSYCIKFAGGVGTQIDALPGQGVTHFSVLSLKPRTSDHNCLNLLAAPGQSVALLNAYDDAGTLLFNIDKSGNCLGGNNASQNLGSASVNWANIFLQNSPIVVSDERQKSNLRRLNEKELKVATFILGQVYQQEKSIQKKGIKKARLHFGVVAQQVAESFAKVGLDPYLYSVNTQERYYEYEEIIPATEAQEAFEIPPAWDPNTGEILIEKVLIPGIPEQPEKKITRVATTLEQIPEQYRSNAVLKEKLGIRYEELYALLFTAMRHHIENLYQEINTLKESKITK